MTKHYLQGLRSIEPDLSDDAGSPIRFTASTETKARDGLVIEARGWQLDNFNSNPSILWSHDYRGERPPIGRAERVWVDGDRLMADITFDQDDPFAVSVEKKYRKGVLSSVSVGWDTIEHDGNRVTKAELLDISAVNIPGDPMALMQRQKMAIRSHIDAILDEIDPAELQGDEAEAVWEGTALRMARLFVSAADDGQINQQAYRRLARQYQRLGKTAPEVPDHLAALDLEGIRGLFLAGEPDLVPELFTVPEPVVRNDLATWWS